MKLTMFLSLAVAGCSDGDDESESKTYDESPPLETGDDTATIVRTSAYPHLDPIGSRLLTAYPSIVVVSWEQDAPASVHIEFSFDGEQRTSPVRALSAGPHEEILLGIPYGVDVTFEIVAEMPEGVIRSDPHAARTAELPEGLPLGTLGTIDPARYDPAVDYLLLSIDEFESIGLGGRWWAVILDRAGRVVWAHQSPSGWMIMHPRLGVDENALLIDHNSYWTMFDGGAASQILEMKIDGTLLQLWDTPGLHHPYTQLPDGTIVYGSYLSGFGNYEEAIYSVDRAGVYNELFICRDWLDSIGEYGRVCGSNTISYRPSTDTLLTSWFTFESLVELDASTGDVLRWFGHVEGAYGFIPSDKAFWYPHGGYFTESGTLLTSSQLTESDNALVVREYEVDDGAQVLREVWSAGEGSGLEGGQMGEAHRLPGGSTLHNLGANAYLREYTPEGDVVWEISWPMEHTVGRSEPILVDLYAFAPERP